MRTIQFPAPCIAGYPEDIKVSDAEMASDGGHSKDVQQRR
jgi:hypothetical protein